MHDLEAAATLTMRRAQSTGSRCSRSNPARPALWPARLRKSRRFRNAAWFVCRLYEAQQDRRLGIPADLIAAHSAVSTAVVQAMARAGLERTPADVAMAITGVAGRDPDEDGNPVGLAFVAAAKRGGRILVEGLQLSGTRQAICASAMLARSAWPTALWNSPSPA
jgi:PncC family amidohydrolase